MAQFVAGAAKLVAGKRIENFAHQFEPEDPLYEYYDDHGRMKRRKQRPMPQGLSNHEEKILLKIKKRAHHLDKGFKLCGIRFGWTFIIGLVPFAGDIADALLSHNLIVKKAQQIEGIPDELIHLAIATFKTNSRNAKLLEDYTATSSGYAAAPSQGARPTATASAQAPPEYAAGSSNRAVPPPPPPPRQ
ncbi:hypothetical protein MEQU1_000059 [Malassezia equina]|uniref:Uncharacterized protein n=1 Tax=Malassezia equina TaxID=1381935 RepID=A0AAF0EBD0_9BASI|nr:hypothetical protein MEQU1_000059 [Malassezia equina]